MGRNNDSGNWGERVAASYLKRKGYRILDTQFHCRFGEIDIIASHRGCIVFAEVKLRKSADFAMALEFVDGPKQNRILSTAAFYLSKFPTALQPRFDVIEVYAPEGPATRKPTINHLEDAFQ